MEQIQIFYTIKTKYFIRTLNKLPTKPFPMDLALSTDEGVPDIYLILDLKYLVKAICLSNYYFRWHIGRESARRAYVDHIIWNIPTEVRFLLILHKRFNGIKSDIPNCCLSGQNYSAFAAVLVPNWKATLKRMVLVR